MLHIHCFKSEDYGFENFIHAKRNSSLGWVGRFTETLTLIKAITKCIVPSTRQGLFLVRTTTIIHCALHMHYAIMVSGVKIGQIGGKMQDLHVLVIILIDFCYSHLLKFKPFFKKIAY